MMVEPPPIESCATTELLITHTTDSTVILCTSVHCTGNEQGQSVKRGQPRSNILCLSPPDSTTPSTNLNSIDRKPRKMGIVGVSDVDWSIGPAMPILLASPPNQESSKLGRRQLDNDTLNLRIMTTLKQNMVMHGRPNLAGYSSV